MMKKLNGIFALFLALVLGAWAYSAETVVAEWDFGASATSTTDGRIADGAVRGATTVTDGWLTMPAASGYMEPQGFQVSKAVHPELAPQSGFRIEAVAKQHDAEPYGDLQTLFDAKYLLDLGPQSREQAFHGFLFGLIKGTNGKIARLRLYLGFQRDSVMVQSDFFDITPDAEQTFGVSYDGRSQVSFWVDGKALGTFAVAPGGPIEPAIQRAVIGDRAGSNHFTWRGAIRKVTLTAFPAAPEPEVLDGEKLLAFWDFGVRTDGTVDGRIGDGFVRGATVVEDGWLTMPAASGNLEPQGFQVSKAVHPELAPQSGFRVEAVAKLREGEFDEIPQTILDTKYYLDLGPKSREPAFHGFLLALVRREDGQARYRFCLGFEKDSIEIFSKYFEVKPGQEQTFAVSYDGIKNVTFYLDGNSVGTAVVKPGGPIQPAIYPAVIGDRHGSNHNPWRGAIRSVKLTVFPAPVAFLSLPARRAFVRGEADATMRVKVQSLQALKAGATVTLTLPECPEILPQVVAVDKELAAGEECEVRVPVKPDYAVGKYAALVTLAGETADGQAVQATLDEQIAIGPKQPQDDFPIVLWSGGVPPQTVKEYGFTHELHWFMHFLLKYGKDSLQTCLNNTLDDAVANGIRYANQFSVREYFGKDYPRKRADGSVVQHGIEAADPGFQAKTVQAAIDFAEMSSDHPGCDAVLLNSEVRDSSVPSFGSSDPKVFEEFAGFPVPEEAVSKNGVDWRSKTDFPLDRVVPYDDPLLVFYRWFWTVGDGWNVVQSKATEALHAHHKLPLWTWFDPAVRVPPLWGCGGSVDVISQWTYGYPDPLRTGTATDELFAMAAGRPGQKVMSMTQFICYRNKTAPVGEKVANPPSWLQGNETAGFISIPPDSVTEATWSIIARPVQGIMYHGSNSVFGESEAYYKANMRSAENSHVPYCTTNPETKVAVAKLHHEVVRPLGPMLKRLGARAPEVVLLESFASSMYAKRGSWGWGEDWTSHVHLMFSWANLSPAIYYEETVLRDGLEGVKVLGLFHCDVLTDAVVAKILDWQAKGGIVVADQHLAPAILPDIVIREIPYAKENDKNKADLQKLARELRAQLDPHFRSFVTADDYDIVTRPRAYKNADYIFAINDKRTYGDYIGQWKRTMEKGMPNSGKITVTRSASVVYDLVRHAAVPFDSKNGVTTIPVSYQTNDGRLFLLLDEAIGEVTLAAPSEVAADVEFAVDAAVLTVAGAPVEALIPVEITLTDAAGAVLDGSGYGCAVDGRVEWFFTIPAGTPSGSAYTLMVKDLASGKTASQTITVK